MRAAAIGLAALLSACAHLPGAHPEPPGLRVLVFNIHAGKDAAGTANLDGVAALVKSTRADLVLLQEVDRLTARSGRVDQVDVLTNATSYDAAFAPSLIHYDSGAYGIAVLSRQGIGYHATFPLPVTPVQTRAGGSSEPRVALLAFAPLNRATWRVFNTHLDPADGPARAQEVAALVGAVKTAAVPGAPIVVGGDFNATPDNPVLQPLVASGLHDAWTECGQGPGLTYPADKPAKRIDYLFLAEGMHCAAAEVIDTQVSDHRPLLVTFKSSSDAARPPSGAGGRATRRRAPLPR